MDQVRAMQLVVRAAGRECAVRGEAGSRIRTPHIMWGRDHVVVVVGKFIPGRSH